MAARAGQAGPVVSEGELEPGAHGVAAPVLGVDGLEASVGVVALVPLDVAVVAPAVSTAAAALARALG
jgi:DNA-binding IclR family transcriptional regulator